MQVEVHRTIAPLAREWEELAERREALPWVRPGWFEAWWPAFGAGRLELVCVRRGGALAGVLALQRRWGVLSSLTNWHSPEYGTLAEDDEARRALLDAVTAPGGAPVTLRFVNAGETDAAEFLAAGRRAGGRVLARRLERSPYVRTDGSWEDFERSIDRRLRSEIRRRRRRLAEQGDLRVEVEDGSERLPELLKRGFDVEGSGWKVEQGTAIVSRPGTLAFYTRVAHWASERGWLRLAFLNLDGRTLAFQYLIEYGGVAYQLKGGYDTAYRKYAPGMLLTHAVLERAFGLGLLSYEFLGEQESFKREWARDVRERMLVQAFPRSVSGLAGWLAYAYGGPLAKRLRKRKSP
jgi:CelD/BcsL family acetyltransferase involved in cellulose biosynthesis